MGFKDEINLSVELEEMKLEIDSLLELDWDLWEVIEVMPWLDLKEGEEVIYLEEVEELY